MPDPMPTPEPVSDPAVGAPEPADEPASDPVAPPSNPVAPPLAPPSDPAPAAASEKGPSGADEVIALIRKLGELKEAGLLSEDEFAAKKRELLDRL